MQTEAEKYLIAILRKIVTAARYHLKLINLGAAKSTVVETSLLADTSDADTKFFVCDRTDIQDCRVDNFYVKKNYICPLEDLQGIPNAGYDTAFANFVLEHISNPQKAAQEMARIIKPGGHLVLSLSNPLAPEFILARLTPTWFHQLFRQDDHEEAYPVKYSYKTINNFINIMNQAGWLLEEEKRFPAVHNYLYRFVFLGSLSKFYDNLLTSLRLKFLLGHAVLHFVRVDKK